MIFTDVQEWDWEPTEVKCEICGSLLWKSDRDNYVCPDCGEAYTEDEIDIDGF